MRPAEQLGPYRLALSEEVFPLTGDALRLGEFATVKNGQKICDLGCGSGVLLLMAARKGENLTLVGVDSSPAAVALTDRNLRDNALSGGAHPGDVRRPESLPAGPFDLVLCNPPYFAAGSGKSAGAARMEEQGALEDFLRASERLLRPGGILTLCHRCDRLTDVLCALRGHHLEPKRLKLTPPLLLVEAVKDARPGGLIVEV